MIKMLPAIAAAIALNLFIAGPVGVCAQADNSEHEALRQETNGILGGPPVLDAPFSAEVVTTWQPMW